MRNTNRKKRKWLKFFGFFLLFLLIIVGAYSYSMYKSLTDAVDTMHEPTDRESSDKRLEELQLKGEPFSVLILGVDERSGDKGRSDTMIVMTVNPKTNSSKMVSIPRDTRTEIIGRGSEDKINHAYAFGGVDMSIATVENFLDIPIDYYMKINMDGFKDIVDAVGGITVNNSFEFSEGGHHYAKGNISLNGDEALAYVRMRKQDPNGDFGRNTRQRQVIQGVLREGASISSLTNYGDIFAALGTNIKTDVAFDEMIEIQKNYKAAAKNIEQLTIEGNATTISGIYYLVVPDEEKQRIHSELKSHLEL
ncbi:LytR family transcriptional regulator [Mesobacillus harenae]|uniref:polyisoprenyl-teichoic acid--peptidoglycan teichoic acid transferase TagU n=1 Tax=Mesobacillus harenae TaxID=2213203 RepID=UPI0015805ACE|nr:LytR family transcriptional regulator [Mesobacillus harenae]